MTKSTFYVTYGFGSGRGYSYSEIEAVDWNEAFWIAMNKTHGGFANVYSTKEEAGVEEFHLRKIPLKKCPPFWKPPEELKEYRKQAREDDTVVHTRLYGPKQRNRTGVKLF